MVELYLPAQSVNVASVAQRDALYQLQGTSTVRLANEKDYASSSSLSIDPASAASAVRDHAFFTGSIDVHCSTFLWWKRCDPPTAVHVSSLISAY